MSAPLLACPFCGSANVMMDRFGAVGRYAVTCEAADCQAVGPEGDTAEAAAEKWAAADARQRATMQHTS
jgi:hypothetical protein